MPKGGARPNTGPKKGSKHKKTLEVEAAREYIKRRVFEELEPLTTAQLDLAKGHLVQEQTISGKRIYLKSPDKGAAEMLLNQTIGKPKETVEHQGELKITELIIDI